MPIAPGGGDDSKNVEYVYIGCSSSTDISSAKFKYKLSTPTTVTSPFKKLYTLVNNSFGQVGYEFVFTRAGVFFISDPLSSPGRIKVHSLEAYRTGGLSVDNITQHIIFCDKDNNILLTEERTNIVGNNAPVFWPINTNIPIS